MLEPKSGGKVTLEQPSSEMPIREKGVVRVTSSQPYTRSKRGRVVTQIPYAGPDGQLGWVSGSFLTLQSTDGQLGEVDKTVNVHPGVSAVQTIALTEKGEFPS